MAELDARLSCCQARGVRLEQGRNTGRRARIAECGLLEDAALKPSCRSVSWLVVVVVVGVLGG